MTTTHAHAWPSLARDLHQQLVPWLLSEDGIFADGYAGELLHHWRQQLAAGQPMDPIGPAEVPA